MKGNGGFVVVLLILAVVVYGFGSYSKYRYLSTEGTITSIESIEDHFISPTTCIITVDGKDRSISGSICNNLKEGEQLCRCEKSWFKFNNTVNMYCEDCERGET